MSSYSRHSQLYSCESMAANGIRSLKILEELMDCGTYLIILKKIEDPSSKNLGFGQFFLLT